MLFRVSTLFWIFSLAFLQSAHALVAAHDPCAAVTKAIWDGGGRPSDAWACLSSVPYKVEIRDNVLEAISKMYNLDIFEFNNLDTPAPLTQHVDIRAEFKRMGTQDYTSDFEFQYDMYKTIRSLNDGHRAWSSCYGGAFKTIQTLPLVSLARSSSSSTSDYAICIAPDAVDLTASANFTRVYKELWGVDVAQLAGLEVVTIDGLDPWTYIDWVANTQTGVYQDVNVRRAAALAGYSSDGLHKGNLWNRDLGTLAEPPFPIRDFVTYEVILPSGEIESVTVPYFSIPLAPFTTAEKFFSDNCLLPPSTSTPARRDSPAPLSLLPRQSVSAPTVCKDPDSKPDYPLSNSPVNSSAYIGGRWNQFFVLPGNESEKVGVVYITTFNLDADATSNCILNAAAEILTGLTNLTALGVKKLIIDTTYDGGGAVLASYFWQRVFTGQTRQSKIGLPGVFRGAELFKKFTAFGLKNGSLDTDNYFGTPLLVDSKANSFPRNHDLYSSNSSSLEINDHKLFVSEVVRDNISLVLTQSPNPAPFFTPENVLVFSNGGTCGSACSLLTRFLHVELGVSTHLASARPDEPIEYSSFAAQAFTSDTLYAEIKATSLSDDPSAPPPLLVRGIYGWPIRGFFYPNSTNFLQYTSIPADKTFALTAEEYLDPLKMYAKAARSKWGVVKVDASSSPFDSDHPLIGSALGTSMNTTITVAAGSSSLAAVGGLASLAIFVLRRRYRKAQAGSYVELERSIAPTESVA